MPTLDLSQDVVTLTRALCDIESVSGNEGPLADAIEAALRPLPHLEVLRDGDAAVARTHVGRAERVVLAGHIDTVPLAATPNLPTRVEGDLVYGRGTADMKGGVAVQLALAAGLAEPTADGVEGGCNGTIRVDVATTGVAAHSARAWMGRNAIHEAAVVLGRLTAYETQDVDVDGLVFRESLNAVMIGGGAAGNVIPDRCVVTVNYR